MKMFGKSQRLIFLSSQFQHSEYLGKNAAVTVIIVINVIFFALSNIEGMHDWMVVNFALFFPQNPNFHWWQLVSNMFMHGGVMHILFNMYGVYAFGSLLEKLWGPKRFVLFYLLCGLGAGVIYLAVNYYKFQGLETALLADGIPALDLERIRSSREMPSDENLHSYWTIFRTPALGASGAVYGILVAFGMMFPDVKLMLVFLPVPIAAKYFIPALVALDLFSGVTGVSIFGGGIAHFAHVGGALIGFLLMIYWRNKIQSRQSLRDDNTFVT
jgi:membrane associated rhomboid family serine protease